MSASPDAVPAAAASTRPAARRLLPGLLLAATGAVAASAKAIVVKLAYRHGVDAATLLALRMLVAFPFFVAMGLWAARQARGRLSAGDWARVAGLGFAGYYLSSWLDFLGLAYISATLERLILYLSPTLVMLIAFLREGVRPTRAQLAALAVSYAGVLLAFGHDIAFQGGRTLLGSALVFAAALSYAVYLYGSGRVVARIGALRLTAYASGVACLLCVGQFLLGHRPGDLLGLPAPVYRLSLLNGTLCTVVPVLTIMLGVRRIGASLTAQVSLLGPVSTIVLGLWLLGEPLGPWQSAGTVLVVAGVLLLGRQGRQG